MVASSVVNKVLKDTTTFPLLIVHTLLREGSDKEESLASFALDDGNRKNGSVPDQTEAMLIRARRKMHLLTERNSELEDTVVALNKKIRELSGPLRHEPRGPTSKSARLPLHSFSLSEEGNDLSFDEIMREETKPKKPDSNTGLALSAINKRMT